MLTLSVDHININIETEAIVLACGLRRFKVETINATGYERLLLMPQTNHRVQLALEQEPGAEGNDVNAVIQYADDPENNKHGVMCSVVELPNAIRLTPKPMSVVDVVGFYKLLDAEGKAHFVESFVPEDRELVRQALVDADEIIYDEGGLHRVDGVCIALPTEIDDPNDPDGEYTIQAGNRKYVIYLNLPLEEAYQPQNSYPKVGERVIVHAEGIQRDGDMYVDGYAESCWVVKDEDHANALANAQQVCIVEA